MPHSKKKDHECSHHTGSRWHNIHFSGKLIVCSVIFGMLLILIGGIVMAIGMDNDNDDDTKADNYDNIQKKPPMLYVGPVIMGIGGFTVIVGVFMCLVETKVCRKMATDSSPLITNEGSETIPKCLRTSNETIPSSSRTHGKHRHGNRKKSPSPRRSKTSKRVQSDVLPTKSSSSTPINVTEYSSKNFLNMSDKFLTPPDTFDQENMQLNGKMQDAENQTSSSLMKSFTSSGMSWTKSSEFQTPDTSFRDNSTSLEFSHRSEDLETSISGSDTPIPSLSVNLRHEFLTPKNSYVDKLPLSNDRERNDEISVSEGTVLDLNGENLTLKPDNQESMFQNKDENHGKLTGSTELKEEPFLLPVKQNEPATNLRVEVESETAIGIEENVVAKNKLIERVITETPSEINFNPVTHKEEAEIDLKNNEYTESESKDKEVLHFKNEQQNASTTNRARKNSFEVENASSEKTKHSISNSVNENDPIKFLKVENLEMKMEGQDELNDEREVEADKLSINSSSSMGNELDFKVQIPDANNGDNLSLTSNNHRSQVQTSSNLQQ